MSSNLQGLSAVDDEFGAGDEGGPFGHQEGDRVGDLRRCAESVAAAAAKRDWVVWSSRGVSTGPGKTAFTRIPDDASSAAAVWVSPRSAHLDDP